MATAKWLRLPIRFSFTSSSAARWQPDKVSRPSFLPKPVVGVNAVACTPTFSISKDGKNIFWTRRVKRSWPHSHGISSTAFSRTAMTSADPEFERQCLPATRIHTLKLRIRSRLLGCGSRIDGTYPDRQRRSRRVSKSARLRRTRILTDALLDLQVRPAR